MFNYFLYTDDHVSDNNHNNREIQTLTTLSLSFASNIISTFVTHFMKILTCYEEIFNTL